MGITNILPLIISVTFVLSAIDAHGQVVKVTPEKPTFGDTLGVTYNPKSMGAKLNTGEQVYVIVGTYFIHGIEWSITKMTRTGDVFKYEFPICQRFSAVQFNFLTLSEWKEDNFHNTVIYRSDGEPVRGGYQSKMWRGYKEMAAKELSLYPDNYAVYPEKWRWASVENRETYLTVVKEDMSRSLSTSVPEQPAADFLFAISKGYLLLKQEEKSREAIRTLFKEYPSSPFTAKAINDYTSQASEQEIKGEGPEEIRQLAWKLIERYPEAKMARSWVTSLARIKEFPLSVIERICKKWSEDAVDNPRPYLALARAYLVRYQNMDQAASSIEKAINLLLQDRLKLYDDIAGAETSALIPSAYLTRAEIALHGQNYSAALSAVKSAQALEKETRPKSYLLEGQIWRQLEQPKRAEAAYLEAWHRGAKEAEQPLKDLFQKKNGGLTGFENYLTANKTGVAVGIDPTKLAPTFNTVSLGGERLDLSALKGKVVVLNFWYVACPPCRAEIPRLNQLVNDFKGKDVVFIALDAIKDLQTFLGKNPFKYHIVPDGETIAERFDIKMYPTHIIIDKQGKISIRQTVGSPNPGQELRPFIERALTEQ